MTGKHPLPREGAHAHRRDLRLFKGVEAWVFDLDNTLYPHEADLFTQINEQIARYVQKLLDHHKVMSAAVKTKQSVNEADADKLADAIQVIGDKYYS